MSGFSGSNGGIAEIAHPERKLRTNKTRKEVTMAIGISGSNGGIVETPLKNEKLKRGKKSKKLITLYLYMKLLGNK